MRGRWLAATGAVMLLSAPPAYQLLIQALEGWSPSTHFPLSSTWSDGHCQLIEETPGDETTPGRFMLLHAPTAVSLVALFFRSRAIDLLSLAAFAGAVLLLVATLPVEGGAAGASLCATALLATVFPWLRHPLPDAATLARGLVGALLMLPHLQIASAWQELAFVASACIGVLGGLAVMLGEWLQLGAAQDAAPAPALGSRL
jgi:hypothetical protein